MTQPDSTAVLEWLDEWMPGALIANGFDAAIVGVGERCGQPTVVVYDADKCIAILASQGMTYDEAVEYFEFNVVGAWVGEDTPLFLRRPPT